VTKLVVPAPKTVKRLFKFLLVKKMHLFKVETLIELEIGLKEAMSLFCKKLSLDTKQNNFQLILQKDVGPENKVFRKGTMTNTILGEATKIEHLRKTLMRNLEILILFVYSSLHFNKN
jgi:hypothetical protein